MNYQYKYVNSFATNDGFTFNGAHAFHTNDKAVLVSQEYGTSILLSKNLFDGIETQNLDNELKFKLVQRAFGSFSHSRQPSDLSERISPKFFMIDLTQACVLRCLYCFRDIKAKKEIISEQSLDDICDYIIEYCHRENKKQIDIQPWGGEPFLAFDRIKRIHDKFQNTGIDARIAMQTCGALLTKELVEEAKKRRIKLGVSIDGPPELHNIHRPLVNGAGSFESMRKGLEVLHENGYFRNHTTISVVTRESIRFIEETVRYFSDELKLHQFKFNIVKPNPLMKRAGLDLTPDEVREFATRMFNALIALHREGGTAVEVNISTKIFNLLKRKCSNICLSRGCMGGRKMIAFDAEGRIFPCDMTDQKNVSFGSIYDGRSLVEVIKDAVEKHPYYKKKTKEECQKCPWYFYCRGGCSSAIQYLKGEFGVGVDEMECAYNSVLYPKIVELLLNEPQMLQSLVQDEEDFMSEIQVD